MQTAILYRHRPKLQPLEKPKPRSKRSIMALRVADLLTELEAKCATGEGIKAAKEWRQSVTGVCLDQRRMRIVCVEIHGVQHIGHWLIEYLNQRLSN